ncbi:hypothetical protein BAE44_0023246 [Dichanthelium oligosanthes]|uniref:Uncharacterized protein n=1 Tax=Dichanthelium oligosanthes TaxID=888268 RepID=A0A1E5US79_9POAL|nr:hypothetical protein BAE44_0023246 [Dichanthelium oligosanthes]
MANHRHKALRKEEGFREPPDLPLEILLDIFARADPVTVVRCAAASKLLRRHIADPSFHRSLRNHADGFVPALLVGMFFYRADEMRHFVSLPPSANLALSLAPANGGDDSFDLYSFRPVASRAGIVVLSRDRISPQRDLWLCVGSPVTGRYAFLPPAAVISVCSHVLLAGDDGEGATRPFFRLLVLDPAFRTQTFSSRTGEWGPVTEPFAHLDLPYGSEIARCSTVVLRGVAHWLYEYHDVNRPSPHGYGVLAVSVAGTAGPATAVEIPPHCPRRRRREVPEDLLLARSAEGRLALLVAESLGIAMWTLLSDDGSASWARRVVVDRERILGSAKLHCHPLGCVGTELEWFAEASGTVLFQVNGAGILLLNLHTGEISQFCQGLSIRRSLRCCRTRWIWVPCLKP